MYDKIYFPYPSYRTDKKYFIITSSNKKVFFGQEGYGDYTIYYKNEGKDKAEKMKKAYIARHSKNGENWGKTGIDSAGWWCRWYLWNLPTKEASYNDIRKRFL